VGGVPMAGVHPKPAALPPAPGAAQLFIFPVAGLFGEFPAGVGVVPERAPVPEVDGSGSPVPVAGAPFIPPVAVPAPGVVAVGPAIPAIPGVAVIPLAAVPPPVAPPAPPAAPPPPACAKAAPAVRANDRTAADAARVPQCPKMVWRLMVLFLSLSARLRCRGSTTYAGAPGCRCAGQGISVRGLKRPWK